MSCANIHQRLTFTRFSSICIQIFSNNTLQIILLAFAPVFILQFFTGGYICVLANFTHRYSNQNNM